MNKLPVTDEEVGKELCFLNPCGNFGSFLNERVSLHIMKKQKKHISQVKL